MTTTQVSKNENIFLKSDFTQKAKAKEVKTNVFEEIMDKTGNSETGFVSESKQDAVNLDNTSNVSKTSFTKSTSSAVKDKIEQSKDGASSEDASLTEDQISDVNNKIKQFLMDKFNVSEDDLENMMANMGITYSDLLNPTKFSDLAAQITSDSDVCSLLTSESFQNVFSDFSELTKQLESDLGVSLEELQNQLQISKEQLVVTDETKKVLLPETSEESTAVLNGTSGDSSEGPSSIGGTEESPIVGEVIQKDVGTDVLATGELVEAPEETVAPVSNKLENKETTVSDENSSEVKVSVVEDSVDLKEASTQEESEDTLFEENTSKDKMNGLEKNVIETVRTSDGSVQTTTFANAVTNEVVQKYTTVDVENIIKQISDGIKVNITPDSTSMELQLTPENLGKINLQVVSKNGAVSAQILTQTEAAKAVVESQVSQLKESLNAQGLKVEAVEVSVASHGFERNLDNSSQNQNFQSSSQNQNTQIRRSTNGSEISYTDESTESAEELSAKIMLEQGNSVNLTA